MWGLISLMSPKGLFDQFHLGTPTGPAQSLPEVPDPVSCPMHQLFLIGIYLDVVLGSMSRADDGLSYQHCALPAMLRPWGCCPVCEDTARTGIPSAPGSPSLREQLALAVPWQQHLSAQAFCDEFILSQPKLSGPPAFLLISSLNRTHLSSLRNWHTAIRFVSLKGKRNSF